VDKIELYRASIQALLQEHDRHLPKNNNDDVENELFFDVERDRYQLMRVGWQELKRVYYTIMHFDIKDGKIWIQQNMTDVDVGQELVDMGVSKQDIILGLHPPYKRPYTGYGVA
jgi:XisI protein